MSLLLQALSPHKSTYNPYNAIMMFGILWLQANASMKRLFPLDPVFNMTARSVSYIAADIPPKHSRFQSQFSVLDLRRFSQS
jgi:hypothetical protein